MAWYPAEKLTVITLSNLMGPGADMLGGKLGAMALGDKVTVPSERAKVALSAAALARYAGYYQLNPTTTAQVTVAGSRAFLQMGNGPKTALYSAGQNRFFRAMPDGDLEFAGAADAPAAELVLYPGNGEGTPNRARRVSEAEVKQMADALAARRAANTANPRSEAAIRKFLTDMVAGTTDYDSLAPGLANAVRAQMERTRPLFQGFGAIKSISFTEVGPGGLDVFKVEFEKGAITMRLLVSDDGKIQTMNFQMA
jgi:hypothetical protein